MTHGVPTFFQFKAPVRGRIADNGCARLDVTGATELFRTTVNAPPRGYYYVNEQKGIYIFSRADWVVGVQVDYTDREVKRSNQTKTTVGGRQSA